MYYKKKEPILINGYELAKKYSTFNIPSKKLIKNLKVGDYVKIGVLVNDFLSQTYMDQIKQLEKENTPESKLVIERAKNIKAERLWFKITEIKMNKYIAICNNDPVKVDLVCNVDYIEFKDYNILDIDSG